jgi:hypothetical protein
MVPPSSKQIAFFVKWYGHSIDFARQPRYISLGHERAPPGLHDGTCRLFTTLCFVVTRAKPPPGHVTGSIVQAGAMSHRQAPSAPVIQCLLPRYTDAELVGLFSGWLASKGMVRTGVSLLHEAEQMGIAAMDGGNNNQVCMGQEATDRRVTRGLHAVCMFAAWLTENARIAGTPAGAHRLCGCLA